MAHSADFLGGLGCGGSMSKRMAAARTKIYGKPRKGAAKRPAYGTELSLYSRLQRHYQHEAELHALEMLDQLTGGSGIHAIEYSPPPLLNRGPMAQRAANQVALSRAEGVRRRALQQAAELAAMQGTRRKR